MEYIPTPRAQGLNLRSGAVLNTTRDIGTPGVQDATDEEASREATTRRDLNISIDGTRSGKTMDDAELNSNRNYRPYRNHARDPDP